MGDVINLVPYLEKKKKKEAATKERAEKNAQITRQITGKSPALVLHPAAPAPVRPLISRRDVDFLRHLASLHVTTNPRVDRLFVDHEDFDDEEIF